MRAVFGFVVLFAMTPLLLMALETGARNGYSLAAASLVNENLNQEESGDFVSKQDLGRQSMQGESKNEDQESQGTHGDSKAPGNNEAKNKYRRASALAQVRQDKNEESIKNPRDLSNQTTDGIDGEDAQNLDKNKEASKDREDYKQEKQDSTTHTSQAKNNQAQNPNAPKPPKGREKIPGHVSKLTREEILQLPHNRPTDLLKRLPGITIKRNANFNPTPAMRIRGLKHSTTIMLDDVILNNLNGDLGVLTSFLLENIEELWLARGNYSSLYSSNIGGVLSISTRLPSSLELHAVTSYGGEFVENTANRNQFRLFLSAGDSFFHKRLRVRVSLGIGMDGGFANLPSFIHKGWEPDSTVSIPNNQSGGFTDGAGRKIIGSAGRSPIGMWNLHTRARYEVSDSITLSSAFGLSVHGFGFRDPSSYLVGQNGAVVDKVNGKDYFVGSGYGGRGNYTNIITSLAYQQDFYESKVRVIFSSANLLSFWQDADISKNADKGGGPGLAWDTASSSNYLEAFYSLGFWKKHEVTAGVQGGYLFLSQANFALSNWKSGSNLIGLPVMPKRSGAPLSSFASHGLLGAAVISLDSKWFENLSTTFGVRYDYWKPLRTKATGSLAASAAKRPSESQFTPKASLSYVPFSFWMISASLGSGFRLPTLSEIYPMSFSTGGGGSQANTDLKPEAGLNIEIGNEFSLGYIDLGLYYFHSELFNLIYASKVGGNLTFRNANHGRLDGIELNVVVPIYDFGNWGRLVFEGSYALNSIRLIRNIADSRIVNKQLPEVPMHTGNLSLHWFPARSVYGKSFRSSAGLASKSSALAPSGKPGALNASRLASPVPKALDSSAYISGLYASVWAYLASSAYTDYSFAPIPANTFGFYEASFDLNARVGYVFYSGFETSLLVLNMTNSRRFDFYRMPGASFHFQVRYQWNPTNRG